MSSRPNVGPPACADDKTYLSGNASRAEGAAPVPLGVPSRLPRGDPPLGLVGPLVGSVLAGSCEGGREGGLETGGIPEAGGMAGGYAGGILGALWGVLGGGMRGRGIALGGDAGSTVLPGLLGVAGVLAVRLHSTGWVSDDESGSKAAWKSHDMPSQVCCCQAQK